MSRLYIDIETIPTKNEAVIQQIRESIKPPGNLSKPETIQKWIDENFDAEFDKAFRKTALDGLYGEILSIAWAFDDEDPICIIRRDSMTLESSLLNKFYDALVSKKDKHGQRVAISQWIGHYITGFDLRFIWQRSVINGIIPLVKIPYDAKPWDGAVFDTKVAWTGSSQYSGAGSMKALAPVFGLHKSDIDGSMVYDMYLDGKFDEIAQYNMDDVEDCRTLHKRMTFAG